MKLDTFMEIYKQKLIEAIIKYPLEYCYPISEVSIVSERMKAAFIRGSYNKDGRAIKATCKVLNIPYTYTAINDFIKSS